MQRKTKDENRDGAGTTATDRVARCPDPGHAQAGPHAVSPETEAGIRARRGGGRPLPSAIRHDMEQRLGCPLDQVRIHTDAYADRLCRSLGALAFTVGADIFFAQGRFDTGTPTGRRLLAHELTHVCQHADGALHSHLDVSHPADEAEREADHAADHAVRDTPHSEQV